MVCIWIMNLLCDFFHHINSTFKLVWGWFFNFFPFHSRKYKEYMHSLRNLQRSTSLIWIILLHTLLTTPFNAAYIYLVFRPTIEPFPQMKYFFNFIYVLYVLGHSINHILYCLTNKQIQEETSKIVFQCKNIHSRRSFKIQVC